MICKKEDVMSLDINEISKIQVVPLKSHSLGAEQRADLDIIKFPQQENPRVLTADEFEKAYDSGDRRAMKEAAKKAPLGDKMPTEAEIAELEKVNSGSYHKVVMVSPKDDGTTEVRYAHNNLIQTVVYDKNGNMIKGKIKTLDKNAGFTRSQVDYFTNEKGQKCWIF